VSPEPCLLPAHLKAPCKLNATHLGHLLEDPGTALLDVRGRPVGFQAPWFGQNSCKERRLAGIQVCRRFPETALIRRLDPEHAVAQLDDVQVDLEDTAFGPDEFDDDGEVGLQSLADKAAAGSQEDVLGDLLRDRAGAAQAFAVFVLGDRLLDRLEV